MKIILIPLTALFLTLNFEAHSQVNNDSSSHRFGNNSLEYTQLLKKSHNQKVTATIMGISGGVICLTGVALALGSLNGLFDPNAHHNDYGSAPDILGIGGAILVVAAIPFAIAAKQNKHKAMLYIQKENVMVTPGIKNTEIVSIGVRIRL